MVLRGHRDDTNVFPIHKALERFGFTVLLKELTWTVSAYLPLLENLLIVFTLTMAVAV